MLKAYGMRDGKAMTVNTPSWMGSITKLINGTCMMMAYDRGLIDLDTPVGEYLPPLKNIKMNRPYYCLNHLLKLLGCSATNVPNGGGGATSIPLDMAKTGQMLLNKGAYGNMRFMKEKTFKKMLPTNLSRVLSEPRRKEYGFGTAWYDKLGVGSFGHGAASAATLCIDPENDMVIVMTRNAAGKNFQEYHFEFY